MSNPGVDPRELVAGLSGPSLLGFADACAEEIVLRGLPLPENFGALAVARASSPSEEVSPTVETDPSSRELINPLLRPKVMKPSVLGDGRVVVYHANLQVEVDGDIRPLRGKPYGILAVLAANADRIVDKDFLGSCVWPSKSLGSNTVDTGVSRARKALGLGAYRDLGDREQGVIRNVWNEGWIALTSLHNQKSD